MAIYRDLYRVARHMGARQGNAQVLCKMVTDGFRENMNETNPDKIEEQREAAVRVITNYMALLAHSMAPPPDSKKQ
jgi:hypothetical protein